MIAIAELVRTLDTSPLLARPMKITPSTASRIGAILLAKNEISPLVLMSDGCGSGVGASLPVTAASTSTACVAWAHTAWPSSTKYIYILPGTR